MSEHIVDGGLAEIYVNCAGLKEAETDEEVSDYEDEMAENEGADFEEDEQMQTIVIRDTTHESQKGKEVVVSESVPVVTQGSQAYEAEARGSQQNVQADDSVSDSDYIPRDECSSEEDVEATKILKKFKAFKRKLKSGQATTLDDVVLGSSIAMPAGFANLEQDGGTEYFERDDEESCDEMGSDGEFRRKPSGGPRLRRPRMYQSSVWE